MYKSDKMCVCWFNLDSSSHLLHFSSLKHEYAPSASIDLEGRRHLAVKKYSTYTKNKLSSNKRVGHEKTASWQRGISQIVSVLHTMVMVETQG